MGSQNRRAPRVGEPCCASANLKSARVGVAVASSILNRFTHRSCERQLHVCYFRVYRVSLLARSAHVFAWHPRAVYIGCSAASPELGRGTLLDIQLWHVMAVIENIEQGNS